MVPIKEETKLLFAGFFTLQHTVTFIDKGETSLFCKQLSLLGRLPQPAA